MTVSVSLRFQCLVCLTRKLDKIKELLYGKNCQRIMKYSVFLHLLDSVYHSLGTIDGSISVFGQFSFYVQSS